MLTIFYTCCYRKVLDSAESMIRNKCVQPMGSIDTITGQGQRRKVYIPHDSSETETTTDKGNGW